MDIYVDRLESVKVPSFACKCAFCTLEHNAKGGPQETEF